MSEEQRADDDISIKLSLSSGDEADLDLEEGADSSPCQEYLRKSSANSLKNSTLGPLPFGSNFDLSTSSGEDVDDVDIDRDRRANSLKRIGSSNSLRRIQTRMASGLSRASSFGSLQQLARLSPRKRNDKFHYRSRKKKDTYDNEENGTSDENNAEKVKKQNTRLTAFIDYEVFMWTCLILTLILAIIDRFAFNVWPRQTYSIGAGSAGSDRLVGFKPGPWSVVVYDCLARISGRYSIICYNFILITKLQSLEILLTTPFVRKYLLDTTNIINANARLHNWNGVGLCVMTLLHIWSILFPCITHGYTAVVVPGVWEWPASERTPPKCTFQGEDEPGCWPGDANVELKQMGLQADDVFRLVEMTLFLAILMPISVRWFATRWHAATKLHRLINLVYFVDIVRRHSHPHSWILNTPIFVIYLLDAYVFRRWFNRNKSPEVKRVKLSDNFMVLFWKSRFGTTDTIGPDYSLLLNNSSFLEEQHIFTCFENRSGLALTGDEEVVDNHFDWTVGVVIRVFRRRRVPRLAGSEVISHTQRMFEEPTIQMLVTGPRQGEMSEKVRLELLSTSKAPLILLGAGSAVNFIIDALQWSCVNKPVRERVSLIYTTRDCHLFEWAVDTISQLLQPCEDRGIFFDVKMAYTGKPKGGSFGNYADLEAIAVLGSTLDSSVCSHMSQRSIASSSKSVKTQAERFDLYSEISPGAKVFCQGSAGVKIAAHSVCKKVGASFYGGRGGAREDLATE